MKGAKALRNDLYNDLSRGSLAGDKPVELAGISPWRSIASKQKDGSE